MYCVSQTFFRTEAATPVDLADTLPKIATLLEQTIPNAVVPENSTNDEGDLNDRGASALHALACATTHQNQTAPHVQRFSVTTGSELLDQTKPWYFGVAFAFVYKYCIGMPDPPAFADHLRFRRKDDAPRLELAAWMKSQARRIESQLRRDWLFLICNNALSLSATQLSHVIAKSYADSGWVLLNSIGFSAVR